MKNIIFGWLLLLTGFSFAQNTQTVRGTVLDKITQIPIPGVKVKIQHATNPWLQMTDVDGNFRFEQIPFGQQEIEFTFSGYQTITLKSVFVGAGKEVVLSISMEEKMTEINEVTIKAKSDKRIPVNEMSTVSTRTFSVEETQKFAAAVNDPARMATSFAGVVSGNDGSNHISIRGNSPNGLIWRMEGVEIPNPNHFSMVGTSGGGISILSAQLMGNSDFSTGAFAAEYGNALSGVFDIRLRKGNNQHREHTFQAGILGIDLATEGPFKKGYAGSYLINYRYSTLNLLGKIGVPIGDANTLFQDLSYQFHLPTKRIGTFGIFGFGGISTQETKAEADSLRWKEDAYYRFESTFLGKTGATGLTHLLLLGKKANLRSALVFSGTENGYKEDKMEYDYVTFSPQMNQSFLQNKITFSSTYTWKINPKTNLRTGLIANRIAYNLTQQERVESQFQTVVSEKNHTFTGQAFGQLSHKFTSKLQANIGIHALGLALNKTYSVEPRLALKYDINEKHHFSLGYGMHSQVQPIGVYFMKIPQVDGTFSQTNRNLKLSKAQHVVFGYDWNYSEHAHIKLETYYQHLSNIPISTDNQSTFSILNQVDGFPSENLINKGLGRNYGVELTWERFLHKNLYYLLSTSLFDSKYQAPNGNWYDTRFNTNFATTFTIGKEWTLSEKRKNRVLGANMKLMYVGGLRYTPIDAQASEEAEEVRFDWNKTNESQNPTYFRTDIRFSIKRNFSKITTTWALDIQNVTNRKNIGGSYWSAETKEIKYWYQTPLIPVLSYKIEF